MGEREEAGSGAGGGGGSGVCRRVVRGRRDGRGNCVMDIERRSCIRVKGRRAADIRGGDRLQARQLRGDVGSRGVGGRLTAAATAVEIMGWI